MRQERMFRILGQIDPELIVMADEPVKTSAWNFYAARNVHFLKYAGCVASLVLLLGLGFVVYQHISQLESAPNEGPITPATGTGASFSGEDVPDIGGGAYVSSENGLSDPSTNYGELIPDATAAPEGLTTTATIDGLPVLTLSFETGGMGYEGYMAHSFEEIKNANPWSEDLGITHLPVFRNAIVYDNAYCVTNPDWDAMKWEQYSIMERFGVNFQETTYNGIEDKWAPALEAISEGTSITVDFDLTTTIRVKENPATLPAELAYTDYNMPYEQYQQIGAYLQEKYTDFIDMDNPCMNIFGGDSDLYDNQRYEIAFYDACEDPVQRILNYNFNRVQFYVLGGTLDLFRVYHPDLSDVVGDYPIISTEEARKLLTDHVYATTVPYDFPGEEYIRHCELVYRDNTYETYFLPYYCFYVELPQEQEHSAYQTYGLNTYGAYYVPAVEGKYIENMPVWELRFN